VTLIQTTNDDEDIKQIEAYGRNNEQVHSGDVRCVVAQEGAPSLGRRSTSLHHVLRDAGLTDLDAELEQLAMDARRSPWGFSALIRRINARSSASIFRRPGLCYPAKDQRELAAECRRLRACSCQINVRYRKLVPTHMWLPCEKDACPW
jgi:hypothetical protein